MTAWTSGNDELRLAAESARDYAALPIEQRRRNEKVERIRQLRRRLSIVMGVETGKPWNGKHLDAIIKIADELSICARALHLDAPAGPLTCPKPVEILPDLAPEFKQIDESLDRVIAMGRGVRS